MVDISYEDSYSFPTNPKNQKKIKADTDIPINEIETMILKNIKASADTKRDRAIFSTMAVFGCRISELLSVRKKDIIIYKKQKDGEIYIDYLGIEFITLKNSSQPRRKVPVNYKMYSPLLDILLDYLKVFEGEDTDLLFPLERTWVWRLCKAYFGREYSPHWWRHLSASRDARLGYSGALLQKKYGWSSIQSSTPYINLNSADVIDFENKVSKNMDESRVFGVGVDDESFVSKQTPILKEVVVPIKKPVVVEKEKESDSEVVF